LTIRARAGWHPVLIARDRSSITLIIFIFPEHLGQQRGPQGFWIFDFGLRIKIYFVFDLFLHDPSGRSTWRLSTGSRMEGMMSS